MIRTPVHRSLNAKGSADLPWLEKVKSIVHMKLLSQKPGTLRGNIIYGSDSPGLSGYDPSHHLPLKNL